MRKIWLSALAIVGAAVVSYVNSCGMIVHMDVTERALNSFVSADDSFPYENILKEHHSYVQAGSPFPDWGYLCGTPAGEDSHWPPFVEAYKAYLEKTYERGSDMWNRNMAFLFGVMSHIEADVLWHWGRKTDNTQSQGFLQSMSHDGSDCKDDWNSGSQSPNCHTLGDTGADFYDGGRGGMAWHNETWSIPTGDLQLIYQSMNLPNETSEKVAECTFVMYLGSILEHHFANMITFHFDTHAAFLTEELDLWYHGGLDDMGVNVAWKWEQLTKMFSRPSEPANQNKTQGGPSCSVFGSSFLRGKASQYAEYIGASMRKTEYGHHEFSFDKSKLLTNTKKLMNMLFTDLGIQPSPIAKAEEPVKSKVGKAMTADKTIASQKQLSYFGKSIAVGDFDGDGKKEAFVGAPGYSLKGSGQLGAAYLVSLNDDGSVPEFDSHDPHLTGTDHYQRFGYSLAVLDVNRDGVDDLVVSAPAYGQGGASDIGDYYVKAYNGRVFVYLGQKGFGIKKGSEPSFVIRSKFENDVFQNLGQNLKVSDCNADGKDDLLILSPMSQQGGDKRGHIAILFDFNSKIDQTNNAIYIEDADFTMAGRDNYQWFGFDALCTPDQTLIVSSPGMRINMGVTQAAGGVFGYSVKDKTVRFALYSNEGQSKFGTSLAYNPKKNQLAVGAPSRDNGMMYHAGKVFIYDLSSTNLTFANPKATFTSYDRAARFGKRVEWVGDEDLVASAPSYTTYNTLAVPNEQGMVYWFSGATNLNGGYSTLWASRTFETQEAGCRHGDTLKYIDSTKQLIIASPFCHNIDSNGQEQRIAGRLYFFNQNKQIRGQQDELFLY